MGFEKAPLAEAEASALDDIALPEQVAGFNLTDLTPTQLYDIDSGPGRVNQPEVTKPDGTVNRYYLWQ